VIGKPLTQVVSERVQPDSDEPEPGEKDFIHRVHVQLSAMWGIGLLVGVLISLAIIFSLSVDVANGVNTVVSLSLSAVLLAATFWMGGGPATAGNKPPHPRVEPTRFNFGGLMSEAIAVPVLFVSDPIVLPGMVVPIALDDAARAAVDAAQASESGKLLIAPRLDDRYPTYGVLASIVQVGRIAGGSAAVVIRGERRAHIGSGTTGPGAALWVEVTEVADTDPTDDTKALATEYKKLLLAMLQRREAWQIVDVVNKITDPSDLADTAGYASYLSDVEKRQLLERTSPSGCGC